jgi:hypothetical protein
MRDTHIGNSAEPSVDHAINGTINLDVLMSYVHCRYKAYLKLANQVGPRTDYETALVEMRMETRWRAIRKLKAGGLHFRPPYN